MFDKPSKNAAIEGATRKMPKALPIVALKNEVLWAEEHLWDSPFGWATPLESLPFRKIPSQVLLDTPVLDWLIRTPNQLSYSALRLINECEEGCLVSQGSWLEWVELARAGRYQTSSSFDVFLNKVTQTLRLQVVEISPEVLGVYSNLPVLLAERQPTTQPVRKFCHDNPHDLMLIAHALTLKIPFLSPHAIFGQYAKLNLKWVW